MATHPTHLSPTWTLALASLASESLRRRSFPGRIEAIGEGVSRPLPICGLTSSVLTPAGSALWSALWTRQDISPARATELRLAGGDAGDPSWSRDVSTIPIMAGHRLQNVVLRDGVTPFSLSDRVFLEGALELARRAAEGLLTQAWLERAGASEDDAVPGALALNETAGWIDGSPKAAKLLVASRVADCTPGDVVLQALRSSRSTREAHVRALPGANGGWVTISVEADALGPGISTVIVDRVAAKPVSPPDTELGTLVIAGLSNREIAFRLGLTVHQVKRQVAALLHSHGVERRADLIKARLGGEAE